MNKKMEVNLDGDEIKMKVIRRADFTHTSTIRTLLYFPGRNLFCSGSNDGYVKIWNFQTFTMEASFNVHSGAIVYHLIKMGENKFLSCGHDGRIYEFSIDEMKKTRTIHAHGVGFIRMRRVSDDRIVVVDDKRNEISVVSVSQCTVLKVLNNVKVVFHCCARIVKSRKYPNCVYTNPTSQHDRVILVDYENDLVKKRFTEHSNYVNTIEVYNDMSQREIVVVGGDKKIIYFYDSELGECLRKIKHDHAIGCVKRISDKFLVVGLYYSGRVFLLDLMNDYCEIAENKDHEKTVYDVQMIEDSKDKVKFLSSGGDKSIYLMEVRGMRIQGLFDETDLKERVCFLMDFCNNIEAGGDEEKEIFEDGHFVKMKIEEIKFLVYTPFMCL